MRGAVDLLRLSGRRGGGRGGGRRRRRGGRGGGRGGEADGKGLLDDRLRGQDVRLEPVSGALISLQRADPRQGPDGRPVRRDPQGREGLTAMDDKADDVLVNSIFGGPLKHECENCGDTATAGADRLPPGWMVVAATPAKLFKDL